MLPVPPSREELVELLFGSKAEFSSWEGDELKMEVTPDRLDLLSEGGLGLALQGVTGAARGLPKITRTLPDASWFITADPSVSPVRPEISAVVVRAPEGAAVEAGLLEEAIRFQEVLHATVGLDRKLASLGVYPLERLRPPFRYALEPLDGIRLVPLDGSGEEAAREFLGRHPLAQRYGGYAGSDDQLLTLRDSGGVLLSLPPILNTRTGGEARPGDRALLLESTGTRKGRVNEGLALLEMVFVARGWSVSPVRVDRPGGTDSGEGLVSPRSLHLPSALLAAISGVGFSAAETEHLVASSRLSAHSEPHGWRVEVPPWRPDLLTAVDVAEDAVLSRGIRVTEGVLPPSRTRGRRLPETRFRHRVEEILLGLGFVPLFTPVLVSRDVVDRIGRSTALELKNPVSEQFALARDSLELSLHLVLERNVRRGYPQRFAEVGPVLVQDPNAEAGATTRYHAGAFLASESAGFADAAALADCVLAAFDAHGVREPTELPGTIPGRAARLRVAGEAVAEMGELHPGVLESIGVPVPVAWTEVDLTALWPLVRRSG